MSIKMLTVCLSITCSLWACAPAAPDVPTAEVPTPAELQVQAQEEARGELLEPALEVIDAPTPAMLKAALAEDPEAMREAAAALGTCHTSTTCPGYGSCTGWSTPGYCSDTCSARCCHDGPSCNEPDIGGRVYKESFRVCFNAAGASCTEWSVTSTYVCGC